MLNASWFPAHAVILDYMALVICKFETSLTISVELKEIQSMDADITSYPRAQSFITVKLQTR